MTPRKPRKGTYAAGVDELERVGRVLGGDRYVPPTPEERQAKIEAWRAQGKRNAAYVRRHGWPSDS